MNFMKKRKLRIFPVQSKARVIVETNDDNEDLTAASCEEMYLIHKVIIRLLHESQSRFPLWASLASHFLCVSTRLVFGDLKVSIQDYISRKSIRRARIPSSNDSISLKTKFKSMLYSLRKFTHSPFLFEFRIPSTMIVETDNSAMLLFGSCL